MKPSCTAAAVVVLILALGACSEAGPSVQGTLATHPQSRSGE